MSLRGRFIHRLQHQGALFATLLVCASITTPTRAQSNDPAAEQVAGKRPASSGRVVRAFDFEEQEYNPLPVPLGWIRAQEDPRVPRIRPGFPIWNGAMLDYQSPAFEGFGSVKLPTSGGSTGLILRRGEINIFPNADYLVSARIRTQGLEHAKARVVAQLIDQHGDAIEGALSTTNLVNSPDSWEQVSLEIEGVFPSAAFVQIELQLLQPKQQYEQRAASAFEVWDEDYNGAAWFDNLIIAQLPRLEISTGTPGNIVESELPPPLHILVRDLTGDAINANIRIFDVHGHEIDSQSLANGNRRVRTDWTPSLPGFGWYRALLEVNVDDQLVGIRALDFIWLSPEDSNSDSGMFGIHAQLTNAKIAESAPVLINGTGVTSASVEAWAYSTTLEDMSKDADAMIAIDELINMGTDLSIILSELPMELADTLAVDPDEVLPVFASSSSLWMKWGSAMLDEFGQAVSKWRFGDRVTQENADTINTQLDAITTALGGYVPGPILVTPWSIDRPIDPSLTLPSRQTLIFDHDGTTEEAMGILVEDWAQAAAQYSTEHENNPPALGMVLRPMHSVGDWSGVEVWSSVGSLARKAISFWWASSATGLENERFDLELRDAWWVSPGKRGQVMPAPELVVWRTLATHLGGRQAIEELDIMPGVRLLVAGPKPGTDTDSQGILILWLDKPSIDPVILNLPLSTQPVKQFDVFNNQTLVPLDYVGPLNLPVHRIEIGRSPIIIKGVNTNLIRFMSALELTPNKLQAKSGTHDHELMFANPWPTTVRGRVYIVEPGGFTGPPGNIDRSWEVSPRVIPFVLDAFETKQIPVKIAYSLGEIAGKKKLTFDVELEADKDYPLMRIEREIELGLDGVEMNLTARRGEDGITVIGVHVTNKLDSDQDFEVIAIPPNESRIRRSINGIKPGEQLTREFAFTNAQSGDKVIVALMLRESSVRLNKSVTVP
jgi:hypothetical protein